MDTTLISSASWGVVLVLAVPFAIIVMNELLERQSDPQSGLASLFRFARDLVLPMAVLVLVLRVVFGITTDNALSNLGSTVFWLLCIVLVYKISALLIGDGEYEPGDWRRHSPQLLLRMVPFSLIAMIVYHVSQQLWALPVREMATTLGIGSVVIAFALQATLSNLVSGLLMIANSPFKTGDWVKVDDVIGQINGVNWRTTEIIDLQGNLVVFPNGAIADGSIYNYSRPTSQTLIELELPFSINTPPNVVKELLEVTMNKTPNVLKTPEPEVLLTNVSNPIMTFVAAYWIEDFGDKDQIQSDFLTRVWYSARRRNIPVPAQMQEFLAQRKPHDEMSEAARIAECRAVLQNIPGFAELSKRGVEDLVSEATILHFAASELILDIGDTEMGLYLISEGDVLLEASLTDGTPAKLDTLGPGGVFGENGLFGRATSTVNAIAQSDCQILLVPHKNFNDVLNREARLNADINALINKRARAARRLSTTQASTVPQEDMANGDFH